jgi:polyhydroxyalkanoic acid synthase PhaR subunit
MKGIQAMPKEENSRVPANPMELWEQWYETTSKVWYQTMNGNKEAYVDPFGLYRTWMKSVENAQEQMQEQLKAGSFGYLDPKEAGKKWFETTTDTWEKATGKELDPLGLTTQWLEMMEDARARILTGANIPADPFTFIKQWYDATSETWATVVGDIIGTERFMESSSQFLESYASFYRTFRRANEEFFSNLQLPTRSDIARVAELVIEVEDKVEQIEDAIEDFVDNYTSAVPGNLDERLEHIEKKLDTFSASVQELTTADNLEKRLDRVESKLDKLLVAFEATRESSKDQALPVEAESV